MRFSPRSTFFTVVALGLPFAVTVGWTLGTPAPAPAPVSAPGGAGGIGKAPPKPAIPATSSVLEWSPRPPRPVAVESSLPGPLGPSVVSTAASSAPPTIVTSGSPGPTPTLQPPVPTPTSVVSTPPSPSATVPPGSAEPVNPGLSAARLVRGS